MQEEQIAKVYKAAIAIYGDGTTALSIRAMESVYLEHLAEGGSPDTETARKMFGADRSPFWFEAWTHARRRERWWDKSFCKF